MKQRPNIIFTSDHGDYQGNRGAIGKDLFLYQDNLYVPMIVHAPFLKTAPAVADGLVQNLDVFATVLDLAELPVPQPTLSRSLLPLMHDPTATVRDAVFAEVFDRKTVHQGRWKLIVESATDHIELYDLEADPNETLNLARNPAEPEKPTPNPEHLGRIAALLKRLVHWQFECEGAHEAPRVRARTPSGAAALSPQGKGVWQIENTEKMTP